MGKFIDLSGMRFGRLTVISRAPSSRYADQTVTRWKCKCDCGNEIAVQGCSLRTGHSKSCGCWQRDYRKNIPPPNKTHGHRYQDKGRCTREYSAWCNMIQRCENPNNTNFKDYGARGIMIDPALRTFEGFMKVLGPCPNRFTLDRIDCNGNYSPGNVRWIDQASQKRNTRRNIAIIHRGRSMCISEWAREIGVTPNCIKRRLMRGWSVERALNNG